MLDEVRRRLLEAGRGLYLWTHGTRVGSWVGHAVLAVFIVAQYVLLDVRDPVAGAILAGFDHFFLRETGQVLAKLAARRPEEIDWEDVRGDFAAPLAAAMLVGAAMTWLGLV